MFTFPGLIGVLIPTSGAGPFNPATLGTLLQRLDAIPSLGKIADSSRTGTSRDIQPGRCYLFDKTDDYIDVGNQGSSIKSLSFWVNAADITLNIDYVIDLNGTDYISIVSSVLTVNGFSGATVTEYINGIESTDIDAIDTWYHVAIVSDTGFTASDLDIARLEGTGFFGGKLFDIRLYTDELTLPEINYIYSRGEVGTDPGTANLVLQYKCDEGAGTAGTNVNCLDSSGNGTDGTITDATLSTFHYEGTDVPYSYQNEVGYTLGTGSNGQAAGVFIPRNEASTSNDTEGNSLQYTGEVPHNATFTNSNCGTFDGVNDYTTTAYSGVTGTAARATGGWFQTSSASTSCILSYGDGGGGVGDEWRINVESGVIWLRLSGGYVNAGSGYDDGASHHVMVTCGASDTFNDVEIYVDGVSLTTTVSGGATAINTGTTNDFIIGSKYGSADFYDGQLAGIRVYDKQLSADEVTYIYTNGASGTDPTTTNLTAMYPIAEGDGTVNYDVSGSNNHGTATSITESTFWGTTQDAFHYNIQNGFEHYDDDATGLEILRVPYRLDGTQITPTISGYTKNQNNPAIAIHNDAETTIDCTGGVADAPWVSKVYRGYAEFDGVNDSITVPNQTEFNVTASGLSLSIWVNADSFGNNDGLITKRGAATYYWSIVWLASGKVRLYINANGASLKLKDSAVLLVDTWYHVVGVIDDSAKTLELYINGTSSGTASYAGGTIDASTDPLKIGQEVSELDGSLFDARVYDDVLTADEVTYIYTNGASGTDPTDTNLVSQWLLNKGNALDSASSYNGTINGATFPTYTVPTAHAFGDSFTPTGQTNQYKIEDSSVQESDYVLFESGISVPANTSMTNEGYTK